MGAGGRPYILHVDIYIYIYLFIYLFIYYIYKKIYICFVTRVPVLAFLRGKAVYIYWHELHSLHMQSVCSLQTRGEAPFELHKLLVLYGTTSLTR